ncbi:urease accessory protein UreD [Conexibacter sp. SYSU D00693]|uniref:urease accessory protein UreD n=1 Tax=Conexibacter sp. SYSU D00693 TaxID=2812560 RepID=UPI00196B687C|nr:urease accessory protein UreD [Conexibacter sp. SYSU D00693]
MQTTASLLAGDEVALDVRLGPGARLELVEVAGLVAHDVRGGTPARLDVEVVLGPGACLSWDAQPLVLAAGCDLRRTTSVELAAGAAALLRDTVVLGRTGQEPGRAHSALHVALEGRPLHAEQLDTADLPLLRSAVVLGDARVLDAVALFGRRAADRDALQLAGPGSVLPVPAPSLAAAHRRTGPAARAWRRTLFTQTDDLADLGASHPPWSLTGSTT